MLISTSKPNHNYDLKLTEHAHVTNNNKKQKNYSKCEWVFEIALKINLHSIYTYNSVYICTEDELADLESMSCYKLMRLRDY